MDGPDENSVFEMRTGSGTVNLVKPASEKMSRTVA